MTDETRATRRDDRHARGFLLVALIALAAPHLGAGVAIAAPVSDRGGGGPTPRVALSDCGSLRDPRQCGRLSVPENPARPDGRRIDLSIVVLPALARDRSQAPLYELAGGPGQAVHGMAGFYEGPGRAFREKRDIVLVDQRGTGRSAPLDCPGLGDAKPMYPVDAVKRCRERLAQRADLAQYTTANSVADLEAVRKALGHDTVDVFAMSYGTRLALAWIEAHPSSVRSAILLGTVPDDATTPLWHARNAQRLLEAVFADCRDDDACRAAWPNLEARWRQLLARKDFDGPARERFRARLVSIANQQSLPAHIERLATQGPEDGGRAPPLSEGLYLSITCAEDVPFIDDAALADAVRDTFLGDYRVARQRAACAVWGVPPRRLEYAREPSPVPVLFIAGARDHVTPAHWAERVAKSFPRGRFVSPPGLAHAPMGVENIECLDRLLLDVAASADLSNLDTGCVGSMRAPPFATR